MIVGFVNYDILRKNIKESYNAGFNHRKLQEGPVLPHSTLKYAVFLDLK